MKIQVGDIVFSKTRQTHHKFDIEGKAALVTNANKLSLALNSMELRLCFMPGQFYRRATALELLARAAE